ncbi:MAG TPA: DNA polymerase III subunit alpha [Thermoanaerobaculia bacterium]|jgi:DNA polymerase-3 subunit alpha|nr:DNA polymerase III subunit alpha [Thermoanaerobaculia bacterium]
MSDFVHLHLHSQFSLLDGANRLDDVIKAAVEAGMPAIALTDHGNMFGAIEFYNKARAAGVKPIVGMEAYVAQGSRLDRTPGRGSSNHLVLLARDETGYRNLLKLTSSSFLEGFYYKPRVDKELLRQHSEGLICLSACLKGEVNELIVGSREKEAEATAREFLEIFGEGNFYLEMQDHGIPEQRLASDAVRRISQRTGIPLVVSNDCHYLRKDDAFAHDVLLCIGTQKSFGDADRLRYASDNFYLKSADEMHRLFPDDHQALENTLAIAERCNLVIPTGKFHLPEFPLPAGYGDLQSYFEKVAREGLDERLAELRRRRAQGLVRHEDEAYRQRLEYEIQVIEKMGFPGYFLVVWDFIRHARENDIPVGPGRGSAAGSVVAYALRITDIDPLQYDLLFERFLNPDRISMPDIDIDFCMRRRGEVIHYVGEKYGRDRVAQIITFGTLAAKAVIRDVGRVMGVPYVKVDRIAKLIPDMTKSLAAVARDEPLASEIARDPEVKQIVEVGSRLEGLTRHASVHAAGVVITPRRLDELVPLYKVTKGDEEQIMTQWDMNVIESLGLLKMDFLGLRTLTVLDDAVKIVRHQGIALDLEEIPLDDPETFRIFAEGRTSGIFQFESRGMTDLLRRFKPSRFDELAALNALYRPGAMTLVDEYIQRKQGKKFGYLTPEMKPILEETYGIIVYQEQVMLIGVEVAGFTMAEADTLRKAMGKKKADVMAKMKAKFVDGAAGRGMAPQKAAELWDKIEPFAGYGFNKSHSVAYANLAYKTAYLKAHYPVAFMAAMLNSELSSSDAIAKYIAECRNMGIELLPPDVNESGYMFTVVGDRIRYGLGAIKGVGESAIESVLAARREAGRFRSLTHLATEVDLRLVNRKVFECLVKAGGFDSLGIPRTPLWHSLDGLLDYAQRRRREREEGQSSLFGMLGGGESNEPAPDLSVRPWPERERLRYEKEALGLFLTGNPLSEHQAVLERLITHTTAALRESIDNLPEGTVTLGGMVAGLSRVKIKSGANAGRFMGRFVLEDLVGSLAVTLFANQLQQFGHLLADEAVVLVKGQVRERGGEVELTVEEIVPLDKQLASRPLAGVDLTLDPALSQSKMLKLRDLLTEHPGDVPVTLEMQFPDRIVRIATQERYKVQLVPELVSSIEGLLGQGSVRERYQAAAG